MSGRFWILLLMMWCAPLNAATQAPRPFPTAEEEFGAAPVEEPLELDFDFTPQVDVLSFTEEFEPPFEAPPEAEGSPLAPSTSPRRAPSRTETPIDVRPPMLGAFGEILMPDETSWLDDLIDDHILLRRNVRDDIEIVLRDDGGFGMTSLNTNLQLRGSEGPTWIGLLFGWHFLSGPRTPDAPSQVYDVGVEFNYAKQINDAWAVHLQLAPLMSTDFDNTTGDALRITGSGLVSYQADDATRLVGGFIFLDRPDLNVLPIAGVRWAASETLHLDLLVPRPKLAWRFDKEGVQERWLYLAGEVGGGSWAIEHDSGMNERLGYQDRRLLLGIETQSANGSRRVLETGYLFDRKLDFNRSGVTRHLGGTALVRWGSLY